VISALGTFSLIWLALWFGLTLVFLLVYRSVRLLLMSLHPDQGSTLLLMLWAAPLLLSFSVTMMLFMPSVEGILVNPHCHGSCQQHVPLVDTPALAWFGFALALLVVLGLLGRFLTSVFKGSQMRRHFDMLSRRQPGYSLLEADEPVVFTLGWWQPKVFISRGMQKRCTPKELDVILDHEEAHRHRRDNLHLLLGRIFGVTIPASWCQMLQRDLQLLSEQTCDFASARKHGAFSVAETLVHVGRVLHRASLPDQGLGFNGSDLGHRVHALLTLDQRKSLKSWHLRVIALLMAIALFTAVDPLHHAAEWLISFIE